MPDQTYPKELYRNNHYRVVQGPEEDREFQSKGWSDTKDAEQKYVVHTSGILEDIPEPKRGPGRPPKNEV